MGRLTEIFEAVKADKVPNNEQLFHIDITNAHDRAALILLRKMKKEDDQLELF